MQPWPPRAKDNRESFAVVRPVFLHTHFSLNFHCMALKHILERAAPHEDSRSTNSAIFNFTS